MTIRYQGRIQTVTTATLEAIEQAIAVLTQRAA